MNNILMKCGHTANAEYEDGQPCCLICAPKIEAFEIVEEKPDLKELSVMFQQTTYTKFITCRLSMIKIIHVSI